MDAQPDNPQAPTLQQIEPGARLDECLAQADAARSPTNSSAAAPVLKHWFGQIPLLKEARRTGESPNVRVIICVSEHKNDVAKVVSERLHDPCPKLDLVCLLDPGDSAATLRERFSNEPRVSFRILPPAEDTVAMRAFVVSLSTDALVLWQSGDKRIVYEGLAEPRPLSIEPEDEVAYYIDDEVQSFPAAAPPDYLLISLTNRCHYRCFFCCAEKQRASRTLRDVSIEKFFSLKTAIESAGLVDLTSPGEVLLYPQVREAMAFVAEHNRHRGFQFTTTGALLTRELILPVAPRIDQITVSLNASTRETYERDMGSTLWDRVLSNLKTVRKVLERDRITLSFVAHGKNIHELPDVVRLAAELDVWHVRIAPFFVTKPEFIRRSLWFCKERTRDLIAEARTIGQKHGVIVSNIQESVQQMSSSFGHQCVMPTWGAYIDMKGDVWACCYSEPHVMGNVYQPGSFEKVWNGKKYRALRKRLYFRQCRECPNLQSDMNRLDRHIATDALSEARARLPKITVAIHAPASVEQVRTAVSCMKGQTYSAWEAILVVNASGDPSTCRAAQDAARTDSRVRCIPDGSEAARELANNLPGSASGMLCSMDPARPFMANRLEMQFKTIGSAEITTANSEPPQIP